MMTIRRLMMTVFLSVIGSSIPMAAQGLDESVDLDALYRQIDEAIELSPQYVAEREKKIGEVKSLLNKEPDQEKRLGLSGQLFSLYKPYRNDSAISYAQYCVRLADAIGRPGSAGRYRSLLAHQFSNADMYVEALDQLRQVDKTALDSLGLTDYYEAWMHVCGQIGAYSEAKDVQRHYFKLQDLYRDSVLMVADKGSETYLHLNTDILSARKLFQDAMRVSDSWLEMVSEGTHERAYAAFYRSVVYDRLGNGEQVRYWVGQSAIDDIKCAVMDQASLLMLAERLCQDGDYERAYRYLNFGKACNLRFCHRLRNYQVGLVLGVLDSCRQDGQDCFSRVCLIASVAFVLLLLALIFLFFRRKKN